jgi:RimJ/RimL family protein N-acetyltransferase
VDALMQVSYNRRTGRLSSPNDTPRRAGLPDGPEAPALDINGKRFALPPLHGRHVYLRPITPADYDFLLRVETGGQLGARWRFGGATPSPEQWAQQTWGGVLAQFIVCSARTNDPIGLVAVYEANFQHGHAHLAVGAFRPERRSPAIILGLAIFLRYVFCCWNFRKLYMQLPEYNYPQFASAEGRYFEIEGRLRDHFFHTGQYWDQLTLALYRDNWLARSQRILDLELLEQRPQNGTPTS